MASSCEANIASLQNQFLKSCVYRLHVVSRVLLHPSSSLMFFFLALSFLIFLPESHGVWFASRVWDSWDTRTTSGVKNDYSRNRFFWGCNCFVVTLPDHPSSSSSDPSLSSSFFCNNDVKMDSSCKKYCNWMRVKGTLQVTQQKERQEGSMFLSRGVLFFREEEEAKRGSKKEETSFLWR